MTAVKKIRAALYAVMMTLVCLTALAAHADEPDLAAEAQTAFRAAERSLDLQTEMPVPAVPIQVERDYVTPPNISQEFARTVLWGATIIIIVIVLISLKNNLWSSSRARRLSREKPEEAVPEAAVARMDRAQIEADELARLGSFAEAMHVLLLQSVGEMRRRLDISIAASLTSREILHRIGLSPAGHGALADIIGRVEISYFGSHQPGEEEYLACRASFEALTNALRQGAAS